MTLTRRLMNINKSPRRIDRNTGSRSKKIIIKRYPKKNYEKKGSQLWKNLNQKKIGFDLVWVFIIIILQCLYENGLKTCSPKLLIWIMTG